ncbi:Yip1 domain-containing protein [Bryocella elongata]|uniref:Yip1 domain-containing protein n=1 Tax=Bryocella elongata TaxID=863522 RepID=A0A1H6AID7_9BACT|nr:YIP1 family protein [Bryocella elongata]SEG47516.1 Yip1 domain-containing protein [Bryocella elongata]
MSDAAVSLEITPPMSQPMRVIDTFVAPSKTFEDILKSANCWLPLVLMAVLTFAWTATIDKTIGFDTVMQVQMAKNPERAAQLQSLPADQRAAQIEMGVKLTRTITYCSFIIVIVFMLIEALLLWAAFNFGLGAKTTFPQVFAVVSFAGLPRALTWVLSMILMAAGVGGDNFDVQNPVGTNLGYYLSEAPKWMQAGGKFFDVLGLWSLGLLILGMAIISKKKVSSSAMIIGGIWVIGLLLTAGITAAMS